MLAGDVTQAIAASSVDAAPAELGPVSVPSGDRVAESTGLAAESTIQVVQRSTDAIVFVDQRVADLIDVASPIADGADLVLLDAESDGIEQISNYLRQCTGVKAIHLLSHGQAARLQLGSVDLSLDNLGDYQQPLQSWRQYLADESNILIYGCDVAAGPQGKELIREIGRLSGAHVAASNDRTGNANMGGDWDLEFQTGPIEQTHSLTDHVKASLSRCLAIDILAAGSMGDEQMELLVNDIVVGSWTLSGTNASLDSFGQYTANVTGASPDTVKVRLVNDRFVPEQGIDRNLRVDWIRIDGVQYETEDPTVLSTGTWINGIGFQPGYWESEYLHTNGFFQYAAVTPPTNGMIDFAQSQWTIEENRSNVSLQLERTDGSTGEATVTYRILEGSALDGSDFATPNENTVVFADGQTFATIDVAIVNDNVSESDEDFQVEIVSVDGAQLGSRSLASITIQDDDDTAPIPPTDGLIGYWKLDDASTTGPIADSSPLGIDGTAQQFSDPFGPSNDLPDTAGDNSGSFSFDGVNDFIAIGPDESLRLTEGTYTQSVWIKPTSTDDAYHAVMGYQTGPYAGTRYPFIYVRNDAVYAGFGTGGNTWKGVIADNVISIGQWNHVAVTFDGNRMELFINGESSASNDSFAGSLPTTALAQFNIGAINNYFVGNLDEVRMYDRALSSSEIQTLLQRPVEPPVSGPGQIGLASTFITANEDSGFVSVGLVRINGSDGPAEVFYQTQDATAFDGVDYVGSVSGSVLMADGETTATIDIPIIDNGTTDGERSFQVSLFGVTGAAQGEPRTATVTILDDESGSGLIGYWTLNETTTDSPVLDHSGSGNDGQALYFNASGGPSSDAPDTDSPNPGAFRFDAGADHIAISHDESLRLVEGTYSQAAWIKPTSTDDAYHAVMGYQVGPYAGTRYPFIYVRHDAIYAGFGTGGNTWKGVIADNVITMNAWNHVAVSFDGSTMQLYVNGELAATNTDFAGSLPTTDIAQLNIGQINNEFVGYIDEVRLYDRAITGAEVRNLIDGASLPPPRVVGFFSADTFAGGFVQPTTVEQLPDGRFLVAERRGTIQVVNLDGSVNPTPLLDINETVNMVGVDRGIMSIVLDPNFAQNRYLYVAYTYDPPEVQGLGGDAGPDGEGGRVARISRFTLDPTWSVADRNSEYVVLGKNSLYQYIGQPNRRPQLNDPQSGLDENGQYINDFIASDELSHTIGDMEFGSDGMLYVSVGDGGSYGRVDPVNLRALDVNSLNGKILRIDPDTGLGLPDNPFFDGDPNSNASRVYSYGLRNPFRFALQPGTDEVFIADVGWLNWEEINTGRGANFGWPAYEGPGLTGGARGSYSSLPQVQQYLATNPEITPPIWTRSHSAGAVAIIMGDFVQGGDYPASLQGAFLFTDIGDQVIRAGRVDANGQLIDVVPVSSSLGFVTDVMRMADGSLYYVDFVSGTLGELTFHV